MLEVPKKESVHVLQSIWGLWYLLLWLLFGKGHVGRTAVATALYIQSDAIDRKTMCVKSVDDGYPAANLDSTRPANIPDIEIMIMPNSAVERAVDGKSLITLHPTLVQPRGSGRVELATTDALAQPRIVYPLLSTDEDIATARLAVRFTMRLAQQFFDSEYPYPCKLAFAPGQNPELLEGWEKTFPKDYMLPTVVASMEPHKEAKTWETVSDEEIDDYMRRVSHTSLHFSGTCPMSNDSKTGVVDQSLRVHGFSNLRIADTSVFPKIPSCHTMAPVMAVAERCADMVKAAWAAKQPA
jgi:choline dehydrogenase-like flavoprotein